MAAGKLLIIVGLILLILGLAMTFGSKIPLIGKLPGDIHFKRDNFSFYFPLTTCLLVSIVISILFWLFKK